MFPVETLYWSQFVALSGQLQADLKSALEEKLSTSKSWDEAKRLLRDAMQERTKLEKQVEEKEQELQQAGADLTSLEDEVRGQAQGSWCMVASFGLPNSSGEVVAEGRSCLVSDLVFHCWPCLFGSLACHHGISAYGIAIMALPCAVSTRVSLPLENSLAAVFEDAAPVLVVRVVPGLTARSSSQGSDRADSLSCASKTVS